MKRIYLFLAVTLSLTFMFSCEKDDPTTTNQEAIAPPLPPQESFVMPFTGFESVDTPGVASNGGIDIRSTPISFRNWFYAGTSVVAWSAIVVLNSAIPVAAFSASFNATPVRNDNGVWSWTAEYELGGNTFTSTLTGEFINNGEDTRWAMTISQDGGFTDVEWYTGVVSVDENRASWTLMYQPENPQPFLQIDYERDPVTDDGMIRYTNIIPNDDGNGHYVEYREDMDGDYNRAYDVFRGSDDFLEIQWNAPTREGRVRNPNHFGDNDWRCWDEDLRDTDC